MAARSIVDVNNRPCIIAIALLAAVTPAAVVLGPVLVGAFVTELGLSDQHAGYLIAAELTGAGVATVIVYYAISRCNWHRILRAALLMCLLGNLVSVAFTEVVTLIPTRFLTGLAVGTIMTMTIVMVGMTREQERNFGFWAMGQVVFAVAGFALLPHLIPIIGISGFFLGMAAVMALLQLCVDQLPARGNAEHQLGFSSLPVAAKRLVPVALLALLLFYIGIGGVWAYVERIGNHAGLDPRFIGYALSGSSVVGIFGALLATWMGTRFGRLAPAGLGYLLVGISIALYFGARAALIFAVASLLFKFAWWFISPYLLASMTTLDPSGRIAILTNFVIGFGLGIGPAIAAWLLGAGGDVGTAGLDFSRVIYLGMSCVAISLLLLVPVIRLNAVAGRRD